MFAGASGLPILGHGKVSSQRFTFFGVLLVVAGVRRRSRLRSDGDSPVSFLESTPNWRVFIFSPLDRFERKLREQAPVPDRSQFNLDSTRSRFDCKLP